MTKPSKIKLQIMVHGPQIKPRLQACDKKGYHRYPREKAQYAKENSTWSLNSSNNSSNVSEGKPEVLEY